MENQCAEGTLRKFGHFGGGKWGFWEKLECERGTLVKTGLIEKMGVPKELEVEVRENECAKGTNGVKQGFCGK